MYERANRTAESFTPPKTLVRGSATLRTRKVTLVAGALYVAGAILGAVTLGAAAAAVKASGANTGTGAFTLDVAPVLARAKVGTYTLRCIVAAANGGTFRLEDPDGVVLGDFALPGAAGGTVAIAEHIRGTIADGATDFAVGDGFDVTVAAAANSASGSPRARLAAAAATDGSQEPSLVLPYDVDATTADVEVVAYESGDFCKEALVLGVGLTLDGVREGLRRRNITFG